MKKSELEDGGIYATNHGAVLVVSTRLVESRHSRANGIRYRWADEKARIRKSTSWHSEYSEIGYLAVEGSLSSVEDVDSAALRKALDENTADYVGLLQPPYAHMGLIFAFGQLKGPARQIEEERKAQRQAEREADREKTRRYNAVARQLNLYLPERHWLRVYAETGDVWGHSSPSITLGIGAMEALVEGIEREAQARAKLVHDIRDEAFKAQIESGELIPNYSEYGADYPE